MKIDNVTIGSDVEFFVCDTKTGEIVSAEGYIKGSKTEPYRFDRSNPYWAIQLDNVLAEGNIPPARTADEFTMYILRLREYIDEVLPEGLTTAALAAAHLDPKYLQTENAKLFGCDPSWCCWDRTEDAPQAKEGSTLRSAGFHIHVGYHEPSMTANVKLAQFMDLGLGVPSVVLEPANDRKKVGYGKSGNFRNQNHGCEYRTLSSFFASTESLIAWAFKGAQWAVQMVNEGYSVSEELGRNIQRIINSEDKKGAEALVNRFAIPLPA